jgi:hypothetical protein
LAHDLPCWALIGLQGKYPEAKENMLDAIELLKQLCGSEHVSVAVALEQLSDVCYKLGDKEEGMVCVTSHVE